MVSNKLFRSDDEASSPITGAPQHGVAEGSAPSATVQPLGTSGAVPSTQLPGDNPGDSSDDPSSDEPDGGNPAGGNNPDGDNHGEDDVPDIGNGGNGGKDGGDHPDDEAPHPPDPEGSDQSSDSGHTTDSDSDNNDFVPIMMNIQSGPSWYTPSEDSLLQGGDVKKVEAWMARLRAFIVDQRKPLSVQRVYDMTLVRVYPDSQPYTLFEDNKATWIQQSEALTAQLQINGILQVDAQGQPNLVPASWEEKLLHFYSLVKTGLSTALKVTPMEAQALYIAFDVYDLQGMLYPTPRIMMERFIKVYKTYDTRPGTPHYRDALTKAGLLLDTMSPSLRETYGQKGTVHPLGYWSLRQLYKLNEPLHTMEQLSIIAQTESEKRNQATAGAQYEAVTMPGKTRQASRIGYPTPLPILPINPAVPTLPRPGKPDNAQGSAPLCTVCSLGGHGADTCFTNNPANAGPTWHPKSIQRYDIWSAALLRDSFAAPPAFNVLKAGTPYFRTLQGRQRPPQLPNTRNQGGNQGNQGQTQGYQGNNRQGNYQGNNRQGSYHGNNRQGGNQGNNRQGGHQGNDRQGGYRRDNQQQHQRQETVMALQQQAAHHEQLMHDTVGAIRQEFARLTAGAQRPSHPHDTHSRDNQPLRIEAAPPANNGPPEPDWYSPAMVVSFAQAPGTLTQAQSQAMYTPTYNPATSGPGSTSAIPLPGAQQHNKTVTRAQHQATTTLLMDEITVLKKDMELVLREIQNLHEFNRALQVRATAMETAQRARFVSTDPVQTFVHDYTRSGHLSQATATLLQGTEPTYGVPYLANLSQQTSLSIRSAAGLLRWNLLMILVDTGSGLNFLSQSTADSLGYATTACNHRTVAFNDQKNSLTQEVSVPVVFCSTTPHEITVWATFVIAPDNSIFDLLLVLVRRHGPDGDGLALVPTFVVEQLVDSSFDEEGEGNWSQLGVYAAHLLPQDGQWLIAPAQEVHAHDDIQPIPVYDEATLMWTLSSVPPEEPQTRTHIRAPDNPRAWHNARVAIPDHPSSAVIHRLLHPRRGGIPGPLLKSTTEFDNPVWVHFDSAHQVHRQSCSVKAYYFANSVVDETLAVRFFLLFAPVLAALMREQNIVAQSVLNRDWDLRTVLDAYQLAVASRMVRRSVLIMTPASADAIENFAWPHSRRSSPVFRGKPLLADYMNHLIHMDQAAVLVYSPNTFPGRYRRYGELDETHTPYTVNGATALHQVMQRRDLLASTVHYLLDNNPDHPMAGNQPGRDPHPAFCLALLQTAAATLAAWVHMHPPRLPVPSTDNRRNTRSGHPLCGVRESMLTTLHVRPSVYMQSIMPLSIWLETEPLLQVYLRRLSYHFTRDSRFASNACDAVSDSRVWILNPMSEAATAAENAFTAPIDFMMDLLRYFPHLRRETPFAMSAIRFSHTNWAYFYVILLMHMVEHGFSLDEYKYEVNRDGSLYSGCADTLYRELDGVENWTSIHTWGKEQGLPIRVSISKQKPGTLIAPTACPQDIPSLHLTHYLTVPRGAIYPAPDASLRVLPTTRVNPPARAQEEIHLLTADRDMARYHQNPAKPQQQLTPGTLYSEDVNPVNVYDLLPMPEPLNAETHPTRPPLSFEPSDRFFTVEEEERCCNQTRCTRLCGTPDISIHPSSIFVITPSALHQALPDIQPQYPDDWGNNNNSDEEVSMEPETTDTDEAEDDHCVDSDSQPAEIQDFFTNRFDDVDWRPGNDFFASQALTYAAAPACVLPIGDPQGSSTPVGLPPAASLLPGRLQSLASCLLNHMDPNFLQEWRHQQQHARRGGHTQPRPRRPSHPDCDLFIIGHHRDGTEAERSEMAAMLNKYTAAVGTHYGGSTAHPARGSRVLQCLINVGLRIHPDKSCFALDAVDFLGFDVSNHGLTPQQAKVQAIKDPAIPSQPERLKNSLIVKWTWGPEQAAAMDKIRGLISTPGKVLRRFNVEARTLIHCDWSKHGLGAVLGQLDAEGLEYLVACASRSLNKHEAEYSSFKGEMLAACWACKIFRVYVLGFHFTLVTDHQPLLWMFSNSNVTGAIARWACMMQSFDFDIMHRPGAQHGNADALSRFPTPRQEDNTGARIDLDADLYAAFPAVPYITYNPLDSDLGIPSSTDSGPLRTQALLKLYPHLLQPYACDGAFTTLPQDVKATTPQHLMDAAVNDQTQWLIITGPECQDFSPAGSNRGLRGPRAAVLQACTTVIGYVQQLQHPAQPLYIIENAAMQHNFRSPAIATEDFTAVNMTIGQPICVDAATFNSGAHRLRNKWQNLVDPFELQRELNTVRRTANISANAFLDPGRSTTRVYRSDAPPFCLANKIGQPRTALPHLSKQLDADIRLADMAKESEPLDIHDDQFNLEYLRQEGYWHQLVRGNAPHMLARSQKTPSRTLLQACDKMVGIKHLKFSWHLDKEVWGSPTYLVPLANLAENTLFRPLLLFLTVTTDSKLRIKSSSSLQNSNALTTPHPFSYSCPGFSSKASVPDPLLKWEGMLSSPLV
eukprot:gene22045-biopygen30732